MSRERYTKLRRANSRVMDKVGQIIVKDKSDFVSMLETCNVGFDGDNYEQLIDAYVDALPESSELQVCTAYLIEDKNKSNFDGMVDNDNVYYNHDVIYNYWDWDWDDPQYNLSEEDQSQFVDSIVKGVSQLGEKALDNRRAKKTGASDVASKKAETKAKLLESVIEAKKAEAAAKKLELAAKAKTTKTVMIVGGVLAGLIIIGTAIYYFKKSSK